MKMIPFVSGGGGRRWRALMKNMQNHSIPATIIACALCARPGHADDVLAWPRPGPASARAATMANSAIHVTHANEWVQFASLAEDAQRQQQQQHDNNTTTTFD
jgi:hypothetical protein